MFDPDPPKISTIEQPLPPKAHSSIKSLAGCVGQWTVFYLAGGSGFAVAGLLHLKLPAWDVPAVFIALSMLILFVIMGVRAKRFQSLYYGAYLGCASA